MDQYILGLSPSNLIKVIRKNKIHQKNGERERERERTQFFRQKNMDQIREMILNLYEIKQGEKKSKHKKVKMMKEM